MKKFLALLFVCAGLTAMAAPHVNKADLTQVNKGQMVMKANTLGNHLTAGVNKNFMEAAKKNVQRTNAYQTNNRAPKRLSDADLAAKDYVCFLYAYDLDENGNLVEADPFYDGYMLFSNGKGAQFYPDTSDGLYFLGLYQSLASESFYFLPLDIDYETGEVALAWGILLDDDTTSTGSGRNRTDVITWTALMSDHYFYDGEQNDCMGTLYNDGSIIFDDDYIYYGYQVTNVYNNNNLTSTDTAYFFRQYVGTEIMAANGSLSYTMEYDGSEMESPVYMFQNEAADTLLVGGMWFFGMPNVLFNVTSDCKAIYNCIAETGDDGTIYLDNPIWDIDDSTISGGLGMMYGIGGYTLDDDGYIDEFIWGFEADATPDQITWEYTGPTNGYHLYYGYNNNVLKWTNGEQFRFPAPDFVRGDVNKDGNVNISDVTTLIDHLLTGDFDDSDDFSGDAADCNEDGGINISDVTVLIDYLLGGAWPAE